MTISLSPTTQTFEKWVRGLDEKFAKASPRQYYGATIHSTLQLLPLGPPQPFGSVGSSCRWTTWAVGIARDTGTRRITRRDDRKESRMVYVFWGVVGEFGEFGEGKETTSIPFYLISQHHTSEWKTEIPYYHYSLTPILPDTPIRSILNARRSAPEHLATLCEPSCGR